MSIAIRQKLRPFLHRPGASCLILGTTTVLRAFPTRIEIGSGFVYDLPVTGPVEGFTLEQDLERNCLFIFGRAKEGFYRIRVSANDGGFVLKGEKGIELEEKIQAEIGFRIETHPERLSLGSHKQLDWDKIRAPQDWMPVLFLLSQKIPPIQPVAYPFPTSFDAFFKAAFRSLLVPRLFDDEYQGLIPEITAVGDPAWLIQEGGRRIRSLFFKQNERRLALLPHLPVELHAGRLIGLKVAGVGTLDLEWSKKCLRRIELRVTTSGEVILELPKTLYAFRVNGEKRSTSEPLLLEAGQTYRLDRFQK